MNKFTPGQRSEIARLIKKAKAEEREANIEKLKCWYETTDCQPEIGELVDLLKDKNIERWRKQLKDKTL